MINRILIEIFKGKLWSKWKYIILFNLGKPELINKKVTIKSTKTVFNWKEQKPYLEVAQVPSASHPPTASVKDPNKYAPNEPKDDIQKFNGQCDENTVYFFVRTAIIFAFIIRCVKRDLLRMVNLECRWILKTDSPVFVLSFNCAIIWLRKIL